MNAPFWSVETGASDKIAPLKNEQIRLFAAYLNIAGAGSLVAAFISEPFAWALTAGTRPWTTALFYAYIFCRLNSFSFGGAADVTKIEWQ